MNSITCVIVIWIQRKAIGTGENEEERVSKPLDAAIMAVSFPSGGVVIGPSLPEHLDSTTC